MRTRADVIGEIHGRCTIIADEDNYRTPAGTNMRKVRIRCECGTEKVTFLQSLRAGRTTSCGCYQREQAIACNTGKLKPKSTHHGLTRSPEYGIWNGMQQRCDNPNRDNYKNYGGRGIKLCKRWRKFINFYNDMGPRPSPDHEIDRIDGDGPYSPANCQWLPHRENSRKRRGVIFTEETVKDVKRRLADGERQCDIGRLYNTDRTHIHSIASGRIWSDVTI